MKDSFLIYISLIFAFTTSQPTLCNGLMTKSNNESDPLTVTCRKTTDFGFCVYTLRSDPRSAGASRVGLARIALDKLRVHVKDASDYLQKLLKRVGDPKAKRVVGTCINLYHLASGKDVPSALRYLNARDYADAISAGLAAIREGEGCQEEINKNPSPIWEMLSSNNEYLHDLSQLAIDIIRLLGK